MPHRNTIQRSLVLGAVNRLRRHVTADEVHAEIVREHATVGRGTVYRNLNQLASEGAIRKVEIPGGADRYEGRCDDHHHAKCTTCGRVFDIEMEHFEDLVQSVKDAHGFEISGHDIMFRGTCPGCLGNHTQEG